MRRLLLAGLVGAASAGPAAAQVADRLADLRLATAVRLALVDDVRTRALAVTVAARDGAVRLEGDLGDRRTVAEVARAVPGVRWLEGFGEPPPGPITPISDRLGDRPVERAPERVTEPAPDRSPAPGEATYHTVRPGDTLFSLARRYDTTVEAIRALNGRASASIRVGERLRVR